MLISPWEVFIIRTALTTEHTDVSFMVASGGRWGETKSLNDNDNSTVYTAVFDIINYDIINNNIIILGIELLIFWPCGLKSEIFQKNLLDLWCSIPRTSEFPNYIYVKFPCKFLMYFQVASSIVVWLRLPYATTTMAAVHHVVFWVCYSVIMYSHF